MPLSTDEVESIVRLEREAALGVNTAELAQERKTALDYYMGDMGQDMPAPDGRSQAVSSDVSDTIEGMMAPLMDIFASSGEVVRFEPVGPEDEEAADQETDYVNHVFMQKNPGFLLLYTFIKDALLSKVGILKVYWDKYEREQRETYSNQDAMALLGLLMNPTTEIVERTEHQDEYGTTLYDVTLSNKSTYACAKVEAVPPEEFGVSPMARSLKEATYCYHEPHGKTESDLIAMGFDAEQVERLETREDTPGVEAMARGYSQSSMTQPDVSIDKSMRVVKVTEHYKVMDYEQNGEPCLYRITTGGDNCEVLTRKGKPAIEQVDELPFAVATPIIMTHRFFGRAVADLVTDLQRIKTALVRALLDNTYLANNQRMEVAMDHAHERTIDDLLAINRPGGIVRTKRPGGLVPIPNNPINQFVFPMIEYIDATREWRTGVTRQGQGIDPNALQNQSATAVAQIFSAAQARIKLIARVLAETGVRDLFALLHGVIRKNDSQANTVRLRNKWVQVDPRNWKTREDMTVNIALGSGSKEQQIANIMNLINLQMQGVQAPNLGLVTPKNIYNSTVKLMDLYQYKNPDQYVTNPDGAPPQQPQPDPAMIEAQSKMQQQQGEMDLAKFKALSEERASQNKILIENRQAEADIAALNVKTQNDIALANRRFELEYELKMMDAQREERKMQHTEEIHRAKVAETVMPEAYRLMSDGWNNQQTQLREAMAAMQEHYQAMRDAMAAPRRIVRDPKTGRPMGIEMDNGRRG